MELAVCNGRFNELNRVIFKFFERDSFLKNISFTHNNNYK